MRAELGRAVPRLGTLVRTHLGHVVSAERLLHEIEVRQALAGPGSGALCDRDRVRSIGAAVGLALDRA